MNTETDMNALTGDKRMTIILPCAGEGSRMGLNTPKELYELDKNVRLIDFSLEHIRAFPIRERIRVAVVIRPWKTTVAEYVAAKLPGINVEPVMFDDSFREWPGSVYSARNYFSSYNMVLLPDSYLGLGTDSIIPSIIPDEFTVNDYGKHLIQSMAETLEFFSVVFGAIQCKDTAVLKSMGAMKVENEQVTEFQDKPSDKLSRFNSFWGCYGFRKESGKLLYNFLAGSVQHQEVSLADQPFYPPGVIPVASYFDLGTWDRIEEFKLKLPAPPSTDESI